MEKFTPHYYKGEWVKDLDTLNFLKRMETLDRMIVKTNELGNIIKNW